MSAPSHALIRSYIVGFILSLVLTLEAYWLAVSQTFSPSSLAYILGALAVAQLGVQLFYFLHLDRALKAPWSIVVFLFMLTTVLTVVIGSLWIMQHLDYQDTHPERTNQYIRRNEDL